MGMTSMIALSDIDELVDTSMKNWMQKKKRVHHGEGLRDMILDDFNRAHEEHVQMFHMMKCLHMKVGGLWQSIIGRLPGVVNLGTGHVSGLDIMTDGTGSFREYGGSGDTVEFIMELRNAYRSDDASSRKQNLMKLGTWVLQHPQYVPIYGIVNSGLSCGEQGEDKWLVSEDGMRFRFLSGRKLLCFLFGHDHYMNVVERFKTALYKHIQH